MVEKTDVPTPEVEKPKEKEDGKQTIALSEFLAYKKGSLEREKRLKGQLAELKELVEARQKDLEVANLNLDDDDEVKSVRKMLLQQKREVDEKRANHDKEVAAFRERERAVRVKELTVQYGIDAESLEGEEDIEGTALRLHAEKLAEENRILKEKTSMPAETKKVEETPKAPEPKVYETGPVATVKRDVMGMSKQEFAEYEKSLKQKAGVA